MPKQDKPAEEVISPDLTENTDDTTLESDNSNTDLTSENNDNQVQTDKKKRRIQLSKKQWIIVGVVTVIILAIAGWLVFGREKTPEPTPKPQANTAKPVAKEIPDVTYLESAQTYTPFTFLANLNILGEENCDPPSYTTGCEPSVTTDELTYHQVGSTKSGGKIIVVTYGLGMDSGDFTIVDNGDRTYTVLALQSTGAGIYAIKTDDYEATTLKRFKDALAAGVDVDTTTKLPGLDFPKEVEIAGQKMSLSEGATGYFILGGLNSVRGSFWGELKHGLPDKLADKDGKSYYKALISDNATYKVYAYYGTVNGVYAIPYQPAGEIASKTDKVAYNWTTGEKNTSAYYSAGSGCGSAGGYVSAKDVTDSMVVAAGKTAGGQTLYQLPNTHPLVVELFEKDYMTGESTNDDSLKNLTVQQLTDKHGYFLAKNGLGEYVVFLRDDLFIRGGCAKPVIYLYPAKKTTLDVRVGADVVISEPNYPKGGWKNVTAEPNGTLRYQNKAYGSLFWEGYGHGAYPEITSGIVVPTAQAAATLRSQLAAQGLQGREITEFMDFWQPHIPNTPYVRISWLTTTQLNQLAPLTLSQQPQTTIRTFLDFEGLQSPIDITPQKFTAPKRNGFTLVEWGGLLRGGIKH